MPQNPFILNRFLHYIIAFFVCQSNSDKITVKSVIKEKIAGDPPAIQQKKRLRSALCSTHPKASFIEAGQHTRRRYSFRSKGTIPENYSFKSFFTLL